MIKQLPICNCEAPFEMPLMWTFVFSDAQWWCPYCGKTWGTHPKKVKNTLELEKRHSLYKHYSEDFLDAKSTQICKAMKLYGKWVVQEKLPVAFKIKAQKIIDGYEFKTILGGTSESL